MDDVKAQIDTSPILFPRQPVGYALMLARSGAVSQGLDQPAELMLALDVSPPDMSCCARSAST